MLPSELKVIAEKAKADARLTSKEVKALHKIMQEAAADGRMSVCISAKRISEDGRYISPEMFDAMIRHELADVGFKVHATVDVSGVYSTTISWG